MTRYDGKVKLKSVILKSDIFVMNSYKEKEILCSRQIRLDIINHRIGSSKAFKPCSSSIIWINIPKIVAFVSPLYLQPENLQQI